MIDRAMIIRKNILKTNSEFNNNNNAKKVLKITITTTSPTNQAFQDIKNILKKFIEELSFESA